MRKNAVAPGAIPPDCLVMLFIIDMITSMMFISVVMPLLTKLFVTTFEGTHIIINEKALICLLRTLR